MAEAGGSGSIQVGQSSTPIIVAPGPSLVTASADIGYAEDAPAGGAVDVDMTDASGDAIVCVHSAGASDPHGDSSALETDDDRNEGGGDGETGPSTSGITVDDVTAWPAVHALATMAHAPSPGLTVTFDVDSSQETASLGPSSGEAAANSASDISGDPPDTFPGSVSDPGENEASHGGELLNEVQGPSSQSTVAQSVPANQSLPQASQPVHAQVAQDEPALSTQAVHPVPTQGSNSGPSPSQQQNIHTLGASAPSLQPVQALSHGQTSQPFDSQGNDIQTSPYGHVPDTTTTAQSGLADQAVFDDFFAGITMEIGVTDDLQITGTASVHFVSTAIDEQVDEEPSSLATVSTGIINTVESDEVSKPITCIRSQDLYGDLHDLQGINWIAMGVTRKQARDFRLQSFHNYVSLKDSDKAAVRPDDKMPWNSESYFRFRKMYVKTTVHLAHFQLRNLLACTTRSTAFYSQCRGVVRKINTLTGAESVAMRFNEHSNVQISTIAADLNVLVAGGFSGEYCISDLTSECTVSTQLVGAACRPFASNDLSLRVLDLKTGKVISAVQFPFAVNCTAISPDRRLRVVVGDSLNAYIIAAEPERSLTRRNNARRPEMLNVLGGHKDYGFACAWAPDGYTLATGNQDRTIKVWDARKWNDAQGQSTPVATLFTEMAGVRSLQFSPAGSGKRVLVAAEEADFVSVIDAECFRTSQGLDSFGEISGVSLTNTGRDLLVLCSDRTRGGLLKFERCDTENTLANGGGVTGRNQVLEMRRPGCSQLDWPGQQDEVPRRVKQRTNRLRLRAAAALDMEPF
ncbi:WD repeat protein [Grosmannia clavigera kw1407]|uniref:WD repeat protein n=1 Tax=Grosmannia clavigera (strain kw1407 / UAMH 11150) TaxID=655863 RepID=F0XHD3_GROCL|nr:WD repeat protein [Grosmannia clavigera kw1407]EFX03150.1 WD repeat protein [Grosmannia clavigera kw1407]